MSITKQSISFLAGLGSSRILTGVSAIKWNYSYILQKKKKGTHTYRALKVTHKESCCSVAKLRLTLCDPMDCSKPGFPVLHYLLDFAQTHVRWVSDAIQPSHPLSPSSSITFNPSQHQGLFQWVGSSHKAAKVLELQLQHHSFQWIFRVDFL